MTFRIYRPIMKRSCVSDGSHEETVKEEHNPEEEEILRHLT